MPVRDTQTDRQTHRQTRLKIRALQVCNQANKKNGGKLNKIKNAKYISTKASTIGI